MKLKTKLFGLALVILFSFSIFTNFFVNQLSTLDVLVSEDIPQSIYDIDSTSYLNQLALIIGNYDEILTQSARNYAFTENIYWKERYLKFEPKLANIITEAENLSNSEDKKLFASIGKANLFLVDLEEQSFKLVEQGRSLEAIELLDGEIYLYQKSIYSGGLETFALRQGHNYEVAIEISTYSANLMTKKAKQIISFMGRMLTFFSVFFLLLLLFSVYSIPKLTKKLTTLTDIVEDISTGKLDVQIDPSLKYENNEIGDLARAFDRVLISLKLAVSKVGISKEDLKLGEALKGKEKAELETSKRVQQLERFAKLAEGRELEMIKLKKKIKELEKKKK